MLDRLTLTPPKSSPLDIVAADPVQGPSNALRVRTAPLEFDASPKRTRPSNTFTFEFSGFNPDQIVYAHYPNFNGRVRANVRMGRASNPCGLLTAGHDQIPVADANVGLWRLQFGLARTSRPRRDAAHPRDGQRLPHLPLGHNAAAPPWGRGWPAARPGRSGQSPSQAAERPGVCSTVPARAPTADPAVPPRRRRVALLAAVAAPAALAAIPAALSAAPTIATDAVCLRPSQKPNRDAVSPPLRMTGAGFPPRQVVPIQVGSRTWYTVVEDIGGFLVEIDVSDRLRLPRPKSSPLGIVATDPSLGPSNALRIRTAPLEFSAYPGGPGRPTP